MVHTVCIIDWIKPPSKATCFGKEHTQVVLVGMLSKIFPVHSDKYKGKWNIKLNYSKLFIHLNFFFTATIMHEYQVY